MFGGQQKVGGGLFNAGAQQTAGLGGGGLFGGQTGQQAGGLFGGQQRPGGLFGQTGGTSTGLGLGGTQVREGGRERERREEEGLICDGVGSFLS